MIGQRSIFVKKSREVYCTLHAAELLPELLLHFLAEVADGGAGTSCS
jgi:hypothetical protein